MISFSQIESWSCNGTESVNSDLVLCPHVEQKWYSLPIGETFCAKHEFTVTKRAHAIKLLCKNVVETFNWKDFFSILVTNYFSILKQFSLFRNIFLDFKFFFLDSVIVFLISFFFFFFFFFFFNFFFFFFFFFFLTLKYFCGFQNFFLDSESFYRLWKFFLDGGYRPP